MTFKYLLDTNTVSDLLRAPQGRVASRIAAEGAASVATSIIVAAELRFGAVKRGSRKLSSRVDTLLDGLLPVLKFEPPADRHYAQLRLALERAGTPIGANDMLIAAHALQLGLIVVTSNLSEFKRVRGLRCLDWLR